MRLTARERDIANRIAVGQEDAQIAAQLGIAVVTVKTRCRNIYDQTGTGTRLELWSFLWKHPTFLDQVMPRSL